MQLKTVFFFILVTLGDAVPPYGNQAPNGRFLFPERAKTD
jgi:hypothetical protein